MQDETSTSEPIALLERLRREEGNSETLTGNPKSRSVYDFLYHDARRVASFLAQFGEHGVTGAVKTTASGEETQSDRKTAGGGGGLLGVVQGQAAIERTVTATGKDLTEKTYDPFWVNAIKFLDFVEENGLLEKDIMNSRLGQIVLVSGPLVFIDPAILKDLYKENSFRDKLRNGTGFKNMFSVGLSDKQKNMQFDLLINILSKMPHIIQVHLLPDAFSVWASLSLEAMVSSSHDVLLKNGALVPGTWSMIGIMDAFPKFRMMPNKNGEIPDYDKMVQDRMTAPIARVMSALAPVVREAIGRPDDYYGVTPLIIFREVGPSNYLPSNAQSG